MKKYGMLLLCTFALYGTVRVHGMAGELTHPSIAWPGDDAKMRERIMSILNEKDAKFLGGRFINADSTLDYGGTMEALSQMLAKLIECEGVRVQVTFVGNPTGPTWTVKHNAWADPLYFGVQVNPASKAVNLEHLALPQFTNTVGASTRNGSPRR